MIWGYTKLVQIDFFLTDVQYLSDLHLKREVHRTGHNKLAKNQVQLWRQMDPSLFSEFHRF